MIELKNPVELHSMEEKDLTELYWQTIQQMEDLDAQKAEIKAEVDARLQDRKRNSMQFGESDVTRFPKVYTTGASVETARKYGATQMIEKIVGTILAKLHKSGVKIEGVEERWEVRITKIKKEEQP